MALQVVGIRSSRCILHIASDMDRARSHWSAACADKIRACRMLLGSPGGEAVILELRVDDGSRICRRGQAWQEWININVHSEIKPEPVK